MAERRDPNDPKQRMSDDRCPICPIQKVALQTRTLMLLNILTWFVSIESNFGHFVQQVYSLNYPIQQIGWSQKCWEPFSSRDYPTRYASVLMKWTKKQIWFCKHCSNDFRVLWFWRIIIMEIYCPSLWQPSLRQRKLGEKSYVLWLAQK